MELRAIHIFIYIYISVWTAKPEILFQRIPGFLLPCVIIFVIHFGTLALWPSGSVVWHSASMALRAHPGHGLFGPHPPLGHATPGFSGMALLAHRLGPRLSLKTRNMEHYGAWILGLNRKQNYYTVVKWLCCQRSSGCVVNEVVVLTVVVLIVVVVHSNN